MPIATLNRSVSIDLIALDNNLDRVKVATTSKMDIQRIFTPTTMGLQSLLFVIAWTAIAVLVKTHGPFPQVSSFIKLNSRIYSFLSFLLFVLILSPLPSHDILAREIFHLSKLWEYVDILGVCAAGGDIGLHFGFHHLTTPWLTYVRVLNGSGIGWKWFGGANTAHHGLMYAYFGGWEGVRKVLDWTGQGQLILGLLVDVCYLVTELMGKDESGRETWALWEEGWRFVVSGALLGSYLVLSRREMKRREGKRMKEGVMAAKGAKEE